MAKWNPFRRKDKDQNESVPQSDSTQPVDPPAPTDPPTPADPPKASSLQPAAPPNEPVPPEPAPAAQSKPAAPAEPEPVKKGFFGKFKSALQKTVSVLNTDLRDIMKEGRLVDDEFLDELFAHLIKTDMGAGPANKIREDIKTGFRGRKLFMKDLISTAKETIREIMKQEEAQVQLADSGPTVVMVVGVNGAGKTTSIAKLVHMFKEQGKSVILGAGDTFRAAAVEQLTIWAQRMGAEIITGKSGSDPASVAYKATEAAYNQNADVVIIDTAGRLQTQSNLMDELGRIHRIINKAANNCSEGSTAPHEVLLVLDATAGQNAISQARGFSEAANCTGIILAKLDGTAKGGVAIPIRQEFGLPVKFIGLGETPDAFAKFDVDTYVDALFDDINEE